MAGWPWPLASWVAPTAGAEPDGRDRRCEDAAGWMAVHSWTCREVGESGGGRRLPEPGWRHRVQPSRREKSTARRPKRMNSSMAATHSQMAETERIDQECRTTTGARVKGARPQGGAGASGEPAPDVPYLQRPLSPDSLPRSSATPPRHSQRGPPYLPSVCSYFPNISGRTFLLFMAAFPLSQKCSCLQHRTVS